MNKNTPIVLFVYNRPDLLGRVVGQLAQQTKPVEQCIVYSDAAASMDAEEGVRLVREILRSECRLPLQVVYREENFGCARNIVEGISEVLSDHEDVIVLEDDVYPSVAFYEAMVRMLDHYRLNEKVFSVGGYPSLLPESLNDYPYDAIVSARFSCWGWATWADRWDRIGRNVLISPCPYKSPSEVPDYAGNDIPFAVDLVLRKPGCYWDLPVALHALKQNYFHVITKENLINNIGTETGVHGKKDSVSRDFFLTNNLLRTKVPIRLPSVDMLECVVNAQRLYLQKLKCCGSKGSMDGRKCSSNERLEVTMLGQARYNFNKWWGNTSGRIKDQFGISREKKNPVPSDYSTIVGKGSVVPCQIEAYFLAINRYVDDGDSVLDVGFGLGYGLNILAIKANKVSGVDVDAKVLEYCNGTVRGRNPKLDRLEIYDGMHLPFEDGQFDVLTCVDVLEHVEDYHTFLDEMLRVSRKGVFISTPNRRPEYTNPDGTPKNYWHLREWSFEELDTILRRHGKVDWNVLDGNFDGPFRINKDVGPETLTLSPFLYSSDRPLK